MQFFKIHSIGNGFLAAMPKPDGGESLHAAMDSIALQEVHKIVCLLEESEAQSLGLEKESTVSQEAGLQYVHYPIVDMQLPVDIPSFARLSQRLHDDVEKGVNTVIHCRAGIGRTGMLCAATLANANYSAKEAVELISQNRGVNVPDTPEQFEWLTIHWDEFTRKA